MIKDIGSMSAEHGERKTSFAVKLRPLIEGSNPYQEIKFFQPGTTNERAVLEEQVLLKTA